MSELDDDDPVLWWGSATPGTNAPSGFMRASEARSMSGERHEYAQGNSQVKAALFAKVLTERDEARAELARVTSYPESRGGPMSDAEKRVEKIREAFSPGGGFAADMKAAGIHVGLGKPGVCVNCGEAWPCAASERPA